MLAAYASVESARELSRRSTWDVVLAALLNGLATLISRELGKESKCDTPPGATDTH